MRFQGTNHTSVTDKQEYRYSQLQAAVFLDVTPDSEPKYHVEIVSLYPAANAASRLLLGDSVDDALSTADLAVKRPGEEVIMLGEGKSPLSKLSVLTFNAPMPFTSPLADLYTARMRLVEAEHLR